MHRLLGLALCFCISLFARGAVAQTQQGVLPADETWSGSITLIGDLTIPAGRTLTIAPGTVINLAPTDGMGSGAHTGIVELIVIGALNAAGTQADPITLQPETAGGTWYGVRLLSGSTATMEHVAISGATYAVDGQGGTFAFRNGTITGAATAGVRIGSGAPEIAGTKIVNNRSYGVLVDGGTPNIHHNELRGNCTTASTSPTIYVNSSATLDHNTVAYNSSCRYGLFLSGLGTPTVTNNVVALNGTYGVYTNSGSEVGSNNLVWRHSTNLFGFVNNNAVIYNPLFVSDTDLHITHRSPARKADSTGGDLGAYPFAGAQTTSLQGKIFEDLALSPGTYSVAGDLIVATGATLTLLPGTTLSFSATDEMAGGTSETKTELVVRGNLSASGTEAGAITLQPASGDWYGVLLAAGSTATFDWVTIASPTYGLDGYETFTFRNGIITGAATAGVRVTAGSPEIASTRILANASYGIMVDSGTPNIHHNELRGNCTTTSTSPALYVNSSARLDHNTVGLNTCRYGVFLTGLGTPVVTNNLVASNGTYGVYTNSGSEVGNNNLIWGHTTNLFGFVNNNGVAANPLFVSTTAPADLHLQAASPARAAGSDASDIGCYPYSSGALDHIVISPSVTTVGVHGTAGFAAFAYDAANNPVPATITWSATAGGTIDSAGVFTAGCTTGSFPAAIQATSGSVTATASVTVVSGPATALGVTPSAATIRVEGSQTFAASALDACGNPLAATPSVVWSVSSPTVGSISSGGVFTGSCAVGTYSGAVIAQAGSLTATANVQLTAGALASLSVSPQAATLPPAATQTFTATGADHCGNPVPVSPTWSVVNGGGQISSAGTFTAGTQAGTFASTVVANEGSISGSATVSVAAGSVVSVEISPNPATLSVGETVQLSAVAYDANHNPITTPIVWSPIAGGTVSSTGLFTAGTLARQFPNAVAATAAGVSGYATVTVSAGPPSSVTVTPSSISVSRGGASTFSATVTDSYGNLCAVPVTWTVSNAAAGSIDAAGQFQAGNTMGSYSGAVVATAGSVYGTASVTVAAGALHHLVISPASATLQPSQSFPFSVEGRDDADNPVPVSATWFVVAGGGAINNMGLFVAGTAAGTYANTVVATASGLSATATVVVAPGALNRITLQPPYLTLTTGGTQRITARGSDLWGNEVALTQLAWSAEPSAGTISNTGLFTAGDTAGDWPAGITATMSTVVAHTGVRVTQSIADAGTPGQPDGGPDAAATSDAAVDGGAPDGGAVDGATDGGADPETPDARPADAGSIDALAADARPTDATAPDAASPDARADGSIVSPSDAAAESRGPESSGGGCSCATAPQELGSFPLAAALLGPVLLLLRLRRRRSGRRE